MNRPIVTLLFALFAALVLSACAVPSSFQTQTPGSVTLLPKESGPVVSGPQVSDRQQLADYQAGLTAVSLVATAPKNVKASGMQINNRQQLADYQANMPLYTAKTTATKTTVSVTTVQQISDRQALADYQASLR